MVRENDAFRAVKAYEPAGSAGIAFAGLDSETDLKFSCHIDHCTLPSDLMIDVKQAVKIAVNYVADILGPENVEEPRIEEVELSDAGDKWSVTHQPSPRLQLVHQQLDAEGRTRKVGPKSSTKRSVAMLCGKTDEFFF